MATASTVFAREKNVLNKKYDNRVHICDRIWEKVHYRAYYQNRVIGTTG